MNQMDVRLEVQDEFFLATAVGEVSVEEVLRVFKNVIDVAMERGLNKILMDFLALTGELSVIDVYEIGKTIAEHCREKSLHPIVAAIGKPPIVTGFGAQVAFNRGLISSTFSEMEPALNWLRAVPAKAQGSR